VTNGRLAEIIDDVVDRAACVAFRQSQSSDQASFALLADPGHGQRWYDQK
jgi:hypothetical protein